MDWTDNYNTETEKSVNQIKGMVAYQLISKKLEPAEQKFFDALLLNAAQQGYNSGITYMLEEYSKRLGDVMKN